MPEIYSQWDRYARNLEAEEPERRKDFHGPEATEIQTPFPLRLLGEKPASTVVVPADLVRVSEDSIIEFVDRLYESEGQGRPIEVIVWGIHTESPSPQSIFGGDFGGSDNPFHRWRWETSTLRVRVAHTTSSAENRVSFGSRQIERVIYDGLFRQFPSSHPMIWLNPRDERITKGAILAMAEEIKTAESKEPEHTISLEQSGAAGIALRAIRDRATGHPLIIGRPHAGQATDSAIGFKFGAYLEMADTAAKRAHFNELFAQYVHS